MQVVYLRYPRNISSETRNWHSRSKWKGTNVSLLDLRALGDWQKAHFMITPSAWQGSWISPTNFYLYFVKEYFKCLKFPGILPCYTRGQHSSLVTRKTSQSGATRVAVEDSHMCSEINEVDGGSTNSICHRSCLSEVTVKEMIQGKE